MTATGQNFEMYQGDTKVLEITVLDENDAVVDIRDCPLTWVLYKAPFGAVALTKTVGSGITLTTPASGIFEISLLPADTENLIGLYNHEVEMEDTLYNISTLLTGTVKIYGSKV